MSCKHLEPNVRAKDIGVDCVHCELERLRNQATRGERVWVLESRHPGEKHWSPHQIFRQQEDAAKAKAQLDLAYPGDFERRIVQYARTPK
jgi:hypothetical protein